MSDHKVTVYDDADNVIGFGVYQGSCDMLKPAYFATDEERNRTWRTQEQWRDCTCSGERSHVFVRDNIGQENMGAPGRQVDACKACRVLFDTHPDAEYWNSVYP